VAARLETAYRYVSGGWCCRPTAESGAPNNFGFHLPLLPSAAVRAKMNGGGGGVAGALRWLTGGAGGSSLDDEEAADAAAP
jgi:hypothetical protein